MTEERRQITGHILACGTQIMWGATFVSTKVLLNYFLPAEVLFTRAVLAFLALLIFYPHHLKLKNPRQELAFAGAGLFGIVLYFMLENHGADHDICFQCGDYCGMCTLFCGSNGGDFL